VKRLAKYTVCFFSLVVLLMAATLGVLWYLWSSNMPFIGSLEEYSPPVITEVFSEDGKAIGRFWTEKRVVVPLEEMSEYMTQAIVSAEDSRFYEHKGIDFQGIFRALTKNVAAGRVSQGGSTITQQVTKALLLKNTTRTYKRKAREAILALQIEKIFSKERILFLYLNQIYLGHGAYGVEAAAQSYFGCTAKELSLAQSALLAGLPQAPSRYSPVSNMTEAKQRQRYVLSRMREEGYITSDQEKEAYEEAIILKDSEENFFDRTPYFTEHVRRYLEEQYGEELLYSGGLKVYTTMDYDMQKSAQAAVVQGLSDLDKREGYRGPVKSLDSDEAMEAFREELGAAMLEEPVKVGEQRLALVEEVDNDKKQVICSMGDEKGILPVSEMKWAREPDPDKAYHEVTIIYPGEVLSKGDVVLCLVKDRQLISGVTQEVKNPLDHSDLVPAAPLEEEYIYDLSLEQEVIPQAALLSLDPSTGKVKSMVGGRSFEESQFNRAIQSKRQPGSAFKPIIYSAALDKGMTAASIILDAPYVSTTRPEDGEEIWKPQNYAEKFYGPTLFRVGLISSRNVITVKILRDIGISYVVDYANNMGIESELAPDLSLSLGSSGLSLKEITAAYAVFANNGMMIEPYFINRIEDRNGNILEEAQPSLKQAISPATAYVMTDVLKAVVSEGTGWRAKALGRPAAGKTGTTNNLIDAWFMGYTPELVTGVWVGYDNLIPMGKDETGSRAACPIWLQFMQEALEDMPVSDFTVPEGVVFAKIDAEKGLLASEFSEKTVFQSFVKGTEPTEYTPDPEAVTVNGFFQMDMGYPEF